MKEIAYEGPPLEEAPDAATKKPVRSKGSALAPTLRTFQSDAVGEAAKTTKLGLLMAERAHKEELGLPRISEESEPHLGRLILLLLLVLAFAVGVGLYVLIGASFHIPLVSDTESAAGDNILLEDGASIAIGNSSREQVPKSIAGLFANSSLARGEVRIMQFYSSDAAGGNVQAATTSALLRTLGGKTPPETLLHSLDPVFVYGMHSGKGPVGFFTFRSRSYAETFAGMLAWEPLMGDALIPALNPKMKKSDIAALAGRAFKDERVAETPARVLSDADGVPAIAYAFPDREMLIIAGDRETLVMLIEQFRNGIK